MTVEELRFALFNIRDQDKELVVRVGSEFVSITGLITDEEAPAVAIEIDFEYDEITDVDTHELPFT